MAVMLSGDCVIVGAVFQSDTSNAHETFGACTKADIQAAVVAADTWASTNAASFNSALPLAARTALTAAQKARLLAYVIKKRYETGV